MRTPDPSEFVELIAESRYLAPHAISNKISKTWAGQASQSPSAKLTPT
jgi:hypothetical protein